MDDVDDILRRLARKGGDDSGRHGSRGDTNGLGTPTIRATLCQRTIGAAARSPLCSLSAPAHELTHTGRKAACGGLGRSGVGTYFFVPAEIRSESDNKTAETTNTM